MKYTNLQLVQDILSGMSGDEIDSVSDTVESRQVLTCVKQAYLNLIALGELPIHNDLFQLQPSGSTSLPVTMTLPDNAQAVFWIKYDNHTATDTTVNFQPVKAMPFEDFIQMVTNLSPSATNITSYLYTNDSMSWTLYCRNDLHPSYYTTANDGTILFDSYNNTVDSTLQASKTLVYGQLAPAWSEGDTFVLPLDDKQFQRLLNEAKSLAFAEVLQSVHQKAEKTARDLKIDQQSSKHKAPLESDYDKVSISGRLNFGQLKPTGRYK